MLRAVIAVAVTVAVAVSAVAVPLIAVALVTVALVAVAAALAAGTVEDEAQDLCVGILQLIHRVENAAPIRMARPDHEQDSVRLVCQNGGICHHIDGGRVQNDILIDVPQLRQELLHPLGAQELRGVGGDIPRQDHFQSRILEGQDRLGQELRLHEHVGEARLGIELHSR